MTEPGDAAGLPISDRMQDLLARAAEDQLSEQRQLAEALTELRGQMTRITDDLAALRLGVERDDRVDTAVGSMSAEVREAVRLIGERLDGLARMVHQRGLDLAELRGGFAELRSNVTAHGEALTGLTGGLDSLPSYGDRVASLQETVVALTDRLGGIDEVRHAVADVDLRVGATADALADVQRSLEAMRQTDGRAAVGELETALAQVAALSGQIQELGATTAPLADRLNSVQESLTLETERNSRLAEQLVSLTARLDEVADNASTARADSQELAHRMHLLQEDVTAIGGNVAGLVESGPDPAELAAALDAARRAGDQIGRVNEMAVQMAEVRAALLGDDGLEAQVAALSQRMSSPSAAMGDAALTDAALGESTQTALAEAVKREVAASESRLAQHLDDAVLALAEVLLRRRPGRVGSALSRSAFSDFWAPTAAEAEAAAAALDAGTDLGDIDLGDAGFGSDAATVLQVEEPVGTGMAPQTEPGVAADSGAAGYDTLGDEAPAAFTKGAAEPAGYDDASADVLDEGEGDADESAVSDLDGADEAAEAPEADATGWLDEDEDEAEEDDDEEPGAGPEPTESWGSDVAEAASGAPAAGADDDESGRIDLARAAAEAAAALGSYEDGSPVPPQPQEDGNGEWAATVQSEVTVEPPRRRRRPWWRPGD